MPVAVCFTDFNDAPKKEVVVVSALGTKMKAGGAWAQTKLIVGMGKN